MHDSMNVTFAAGQTIRVISQIIGKGGAYDDWQEYVIVGFEGDPIHTVVCKDAETGREVKQPVEYLTLTVYND